MKLQEMEMCRPFAHWKSYGLWGPLNLDNPCCQFPIIYFRKSKYIDNETYLKIMKAISVILKDNIEIEKSK